MIASLINILATFLVGSCGVREVKISYKIEGKLCPLDKVKVDIM